MRTALFAVAFLTIVGSCAWAQFDTDNHVVTVTVGETAWLALNDALSGGPAPDVVLPIIIDPATGAGAATDSSCAMNWGTNGGTSSGGAVDYKITVDELAINYGGNGVIDYDLTVTADSLVKLSGVDAGIGAVVTLDGLGAVKDFITGIDTAVGTCVLRYDAAAVTADGNATESRTVRYTITK